MTGRDAACLTLPEARATLRAVGWFILHGPGRLLGPEGEPLLSARQKLAAAVEEG